jgi:hypothetical protein
LPFSELGIFKYLNIFQPTTTNFGVPTRPAAACLFGKWHHHLRRTLQISSFTDDGCIPIILGSGGQVWTSEYFRQTSLIPLMALQILHGDPNPAPSDGVLQDSHSSDAFFFYYRVYRGGE